MINGLFPNKVYVTFGGLVMQLWINGLMKLAILSFVFLEGACAPKAGSDRWFNETSIKDIKHYYSEACQRYGFRLGNQAFAECIQREINEQKQRNAIIKNNNANTSGSLVTGTSKSGVTIVLTETFD